MHPHEVVHLEHDGRVLLVDAAGKGPRLPVSGRMSTDAMLRLPTRNEVDAMEIPWLEFRPTRIRFGDQICMVIKGYPKIDWPSHWALKDNLISDNSVHPIAREAIYRSIHRLVSKVMICNNQN